MDNFEHFRVYNNLIRYAIKTIFISILITQVLGINIHSYAYIIIFSLMSFQISSLVAFLLVNNFADHFHIIQELSKRLCSF